MQALARILFEMQPLDAHSDGLAIGEVDMDFPLSHHRLLVLRDLIAGRQIGIEIVLPIEHRMEVDLGL